MRGASAIVVAALAALILGLVAWGVIDGQASGKAWSTCASSKKDLDAKQRLAGCSRAIQTGHVGSGSLREAYSRRAELYVKARQYPEAIVDADRALEFDPQNPVMLNQACWFRAISGLELDRAKDQCDRALKIGAEDEDAESGFANAYDSRGLVELKQSNPKAALEDYEAALEARPDYPHYLYGRGIAESRLGETAKAEADFKTALAKDKTIAATYQGYGIAP